MHYTSIQQALEDTDPGTSAFGTVLIGRKASRAKIGIPFIVVKGRAAGPKLWINGQVHGNEVCSIVSAIKFCRTIDPAKLKGAIVLTTTSNPLAFDSRTMFSPQDSANLDQSFPGRPDGWITERMAHVLITAIQEVSPDLLISMHSQGTECASKTYTVFKRPPETTVGYADLFPFMSLFRPFVICRMSVTPGSGEIVGNHAGALDYQCMLRGIPSFMVELGTGQRAEEKDVAAGILAFIDVLRRLGMTDEKPQASSALDMPLVVRRGHVTVGEGGLFISDCQPGGVVRAGEPLGIVMDLHGETVESVVLDHDVCVIAIRRDPVVHTGDNVAYVAHEWEPIEMGLRG